MKIQPKEEIYNILKGTISCYLDKHCSVIKKNSYSEIPKIVCFELGMDFYNLIIINNQLIYKYLITSKYKAPSPYIACTKIKEIELLQMLERLERPIKPLRVNYLKHRLIYL